jgi:hypothetical protein
MSYWEYFFEEAGVPKKEIHKCLCWAFGEDYGSLPLSELKDRWNERHGDLFLLYETDLINESLKQIGKAYLKRKECK